MGLGLTTAAFVFTHCLGTSPGRYGHPMVEQGKAGSSIFGPSGGATLAAECGGSALEALCLFLCPTFSLSAAKEAPDHPGASFEAISLPPEPNPLANVTT